MQLAHPIFARLYSRAVPYADRAGAAKHRQELLDDLRGRVLEIGAGSGSNFSYYPPSVSAVIAVEPEPYLRRRAISASASASVPVRVLAADATQLPLASESVDAVVFSLVLCSLVAPDAALVEARRVLVRGGELRFYEHIRSDEPAVARRQDLVDSIWPHFAGGCHCNRDTERTIAHAGFTIVSSRRFQFRPGVVAMPIAPHVIGKAIAELN